MLSVVWLRSHNLTEDNKKIVWSQWNFNSNKTNGIEIREIQELLISLKFLLQSNYVSQLDTLKY